MLRNRHLLYGNSKVIKNSFLVFSKIGNASSCFCFWFLFGFSHASIRSACRWSSLKACLSVLFDSVGDFLFLSNIDPPFVQTPPHKISIPIKGRLPGCLAEFSEGFTVKGFAIHNTRDFKIQRRGRKQQLCTCITLNCTFLCPFLHDYDVKMAISLFTEYIKEQRRNFISLSQLECCSP